MSLPRRTLATLPQPDTGAPAEPISMAVFAASRDAARQPAAVGSDAVRSLLEDASHGRDAATLGLLSQGEIPPTFIAPLADYLQASRDASVPGGGFDIFEWLRVASSARLSALANRPQTPEPVAPRMSTFTSLNEMRRRMPAPPIPPLAIGRVSMSSIAFSAGSEAAQPLQPAYRPTRVISMQVQNHRRPAFAGLRGSTGKHRAQ